MPESHAPADLLDYFAARLPAAKVKRFGLRGRGPVRELTLTVGADVFRGKVARGRLLLTPDLAPARWVDQLLTALTTAAAGDARLRADLSRAGWKLRHAGSTESDPPTPLS